MKTYVEMTWPEIQDYMTNPGYPEEVGFDPQKDRWYVPKEWIENETN